MVTSLMGRVKEGRSRKRQEQLSSEPTPATRRPGSTGGRGEGERHFAHRICQSSKQLFPIQKITLPTPFLNLVSTNIFDFEEKHFIVCKTINKIISKIFLTR